MMDEAAAREIERLRFERDVAARLADEWLEKLLESERHRKQLSEYIETLAKGGIEAATGAGK